MAQADAVIAVAMAQRGKPYVFGAAGPDKFDCSGLVVYAYQHGAGIKLPHFTGTLLGKGTPISKSQLAPADLVFPNPSHVGIYIGGGQMVVAPHTGTVVQVQKVGTVVAARRIIAPGSTVDTTNVNTTTTVGLPGIDQVNALVGLFKDINDTTKYLTDPGTIKRVGLFLAGGFLVLIGLFKWDSVSGAVYSGVKKVASSARSQ